MKNNDYLSENEALKYIHSTLWRGSILGLSRIEKLLELMGNPQKKLKFIHIAGTNGKGSTAAMLSSIMQQAGYITGLYTSPVILCFEERIQVNQIHISLSEIEELTVYIKQFADTMPDPPTEFEIMTTLSCAYFLKKGCQIVILEVGLGGRLDATNVIDVPEAAVITAIGLDHVAELGDSLQKIAYEKAGIIKKGGDVVLYPHEPEIHRIFEEIATERGAKIFDVSISDIKPVYNNLDGQKFNYSKFNDLEISLLGEHQQKNAATAIETILLLRDKGWKINDNAVYTGLKSAIWPGRFEVIHKKPYFVVDGGHNAQGVMSLAKSLMLYFPDKKIIFITGVLADKDYAGMMEIIAPLAKSFITVTPNNDRALSASELSFYLKQFHEDVTACSTISGGVGKAFEKAGENDVICAFGSLYMLGEIKRHFKTL